MAKRKQPTEAEIDAIIEKHKGPIMTINDEQLGHIADACELDGSMSVDRMCLFISGIGLMLGIPESYSNKYLDARYGVSNK